MSGALNAVELNAVERALWSLQQLVPDKGVSNIAVAVELPQPVQWWPLQAAVDLLVARHPALRYRYPTVGGLPERRPAEVGEVRIDVDIRTCGAASLEDELTRYAAGSFELGTGPLIRVGQFLVESGVQVICLVAHHIVTDAASFHTLALELGEAIPALSEGRSSAEPVGPLPAPAVVEPDEAAVAAWRSDLAGVDPSGMRLAEGRVPTAAPTFAGATATLPVQGSTVADALGVLRKRCRATDATVLLAAYYLTLYRHGAAEDLVVGVMMDTRKERTAGHVGYDVATVPLRVRLRPEATFADLVSQVSGKLVAAIETGPVSFELLAADHAPAPAGADADDDPNWWRNRLVRHLFNFRPGYATASPLGAGSRLREVHTGFSRFDLELTAQRADGRLHVHLLHSTEVHDPPFAERFLARLDLALRQAAADPDRVLADFDLRTEADRTVIADANRTERTWPLPHTVVGTIGAAARARADAVAVRHDGRSTTYGELFAAAWAVRETVLRHSTGPDPIVGLAGRRGAGLAAAVLGVWSAGAAYLPIDPGQPARRIAAQLADVDCRLVLGADELAPECREGRRCLPLPDLSSPGEYREPPPEPLPGGAAYVIYTSGSTGRPKGVRLTHANLLNVVRHFAAELDADRTTSMTWLTTFAFDISVLELVLPLTVGGRVVVAGDDAPAHPARLLELIERERVSIVQATPTTWRLTAPGAAGRLAGRTLLCGGEPLTPALARDLLATGARVVNVYGPTETTIWSTAAEITSDARITVGRPIANTRAHVLDDRGRPQPIGLAGELCLSGQGLAVGYHDRPALTRDRFVTHPELGRYYRTGDRARWLPTGDLELLGRTDRQVKLRAHRIELGEIEAVLESHPAISAAAAVLRGDPAGAGVIAAFVTVATGADAVSPAELWDHAAASLPGYSVPTSITVLPAVPRNSSGKVDYGALDALPDAVEEIPRPAAVAVPADPLETDLLALWQALLRRPGLGPDANFFLNGGHSLLAAQLAEVASDKLGQRLTMSMVFQAPTPAALATLVRNGRQA
ncbi:amino acid adenylation domain-containing protein [Cryptosporangium sp. NPDC051539]|uniref:amino acid adenylation domain-containing protein n=1 Tax=Cryptosporangium sp. NPDC051539 TaxID=3363962 RepID=UPI0037A735AE